MTPKEAAEQAIAKYPKARRIPVENVAGWGTDRMANAINLAQDIRLYGWKGQTLAAIRFALVLQDKL